MSDTPRLPLEPLMQAHGGSWRSFREKTRTNTQRLQTAAEEGLTFEQADRLAVRLGVHPLEVWGDAWLSS